MAVSGIRMLQYSQNMLETRMPPASKSKRFMPKMPLRNVPWWHSVS